MSDIPAVRVSMAATPSEKDASTPASLATSSPAPSQKLRSCITCRHRKVRCDKQSPCSNCRRANISCVFPPTDRPPRWARRFERFSNSAATSQRSDPTDEQVMERVKSLEGLVKELRAQLEQATAGTRSARSNSFGSINTHLSSNSDHNTSHHDDASRPTTDLQKKFGRLVHHDGGRSRYISSGFWSRVNDELDGLKMETTQSPEGEEDYSSDDETLHSQIPSLREAERTPSERNAFLFRHNLGPYTSDLSEFHPLPSQVPFLLNIFHDNINLGIQIVHLPTVQQMVRDVRINGMSQLSPAKEALMFAIYYAAITSMEQEDVITNFGTAETDLNLKFRLGFEHALAKADFLNVPDIAIVQALVVFLFLVRRHDSPRFVWTMTGLAIRMAQGLGLHRDGLNFPRMTSYDVEIRRRVWWTVCMLDIRASEDQGSDMGIISFDTKKPLNINDSDIAPGRMDRPTEHQGMTDMSLALYNVETTQIARRMMILAVKNSAPSLDQQNHLIDEIYQTFERYMSPYSQDPGSIIYWVFESITRLVMAKTRMLLYLPVLFTSTNNQLSDEIRTRLLVSGIEIAEYNHALNAEHRARQWRWVFQTYTHWYAIVYLMIELSRRSWSPTIERAWAALHSSWLIPSQSHLEKDLRIWVPLRKLMATGRRHRQTELARLRQDPEAARRLEVEDMQLPLPASSGPYSTGANAADLFRKRWRQLVAPSEGVEAAVHKAEPFMTVVSPSTYSQYGNTASVESASMLGHGNQVEPAYLAERQSAPQHMSNIDLHSSNPTAQTSSNPSALSQTASVPHVMPAAISDWLDVRSFGPGFVPWVWPDADPSAGNTSDTNDDAFDFSMDLDNEMDWYSWVESAKDIEREVGPGGPKSAEGRAVP